MREAFKRRRRRLFTSHVSPHFRFSCVKPSEGEREREKLESNASARQTDRPSVRGAALGLSTERPQRYDCVDGQKSESGGERERDGEGEKGKARLLMELPAPKTVAASYSEFAQHSPEHLDWFVISFLSVSIPCMALGVLFVKCRTSLPASLFLRIWRDPPATLPLLVPRASQTLAFQGKGEGRETLFSSASNFRL